MAKSSHSYTFLDVAIIPYCTINILPLDEGVGVD